LFIGRLPSVADPRVRRSAPRHRCAARAALVRQSWPAARRLSIRSGVGR